MSTIIQLKKCGNRRSTLNSLEVSRVLQLSVFRKIAVRGNEGLLKTIGSKVNLEIKEVVFSAV